MTPQQRSLDDERPSIQGRSVRTLAACRWSAACPALGVMTAFTFPRLAHMRGPWLIAKFIDPDAEILDVPADQAPA